MSSGLQHLFLGLLFSVSFLVGSVLVDLDHFRVFGGNHSFKEMLNGFNGDFRDKERTVFFFHKPIIFYSVVAFVVGWAVHLRLDGVI